MKTLEKIKNILREHKGELKEKFKVREIGIFGSYIKREQKRRSDIDLLVEFEEVPDLLTFIHLERYLSRLLKKKVDLVEKKSVRSELKEIILKEAVPV